MKRILSLILVFVTIAFLTVGCGEKDRILYKKVDLEDYVELCDYKKISIDTTTKEYKENYEALLLEDVINNKLNAKEAVTEGKVALGDIANIDYVGKKDGVAFEGGTAEGQDLTIGSNSFIDGFETGLIGAEIGSTVDLNLTFPTDYHSADLAGKAVVFTVKINSVKPALKPEEYYKELGYKSVKAYYNEIKKKINSIFVLEELINNSSVNDFPKEDAEIIRAQTQAIIEENLKKYEMDLKSYVNGSGMTLDQFNSTLLEEQVYPLMKEQMPLYAVLDAEKIKITTEEVEKVIKDSVKEYGSNVTAEDLKKAYGEYYFENVLVTEKVADVLLEYAKIK